MILARLTANSQGVAPAQIESVSLTTTVTAQHQQARIVGVSVPGGLKRGKNTVQTILAAYGTQPLQVATTELVIPAGTPTNGVLTVAAPRNYYDEEYYFFRSAAGSKRFTDTRPTVADIIAGIAKVPQNNDLLVTYQARSSRPGFPQERSAGGSKGVVKTSSHTAWVTQGRISLPTGMIILHVMPTTVRYNGRVRLVGIVPSAHGKSNVKIYAAPSRHDVVRACGHRPAHRQSPHRDVPLRGIQDDAQHDLQGGLGRRRQVPGRHGHQERPGARIIDPRGHAGTRAAGRPRELVATLKPLQPGAKVWFERLVGGKWVPIKGPGDRQRHGLDSWAPPRHQHRASSLCGSA